MVMIRSVYDEEYRSDVYGTTCDDPSMTQQQFKDECDINSIIKRYTNTGFYYDPITDLRLFDRKPMYGDFSDLLDYRDSLDAVKHIQEAFLELSSEIRNRFENDPAQFLNFLADPANADEAKRMGLYVPEEKFVNPEVDDMGQNVPEKESKP